MKSRYNVAMPIRALAICLALGPAVHAASLRELADARGILIGAAVNPSLLTDAAYTDTLTRDFNLVVPENVMKFGPLRPTRDTYNFAPADHLVEFAESRKMKVRGHTLVWHNQTARWLTADLPAQEVATILEDHIRTVLTHFQGKVFAWDVVNEAIDPETHGMRKTIWLDKLGPDYLDKAFRWAHEADPTAKLFYNDYDADGVNAKSDAVYALLKGMKQRGVPIGGVGLQMHVSLASAPSAEQLAANIQRMAALGLEVHITEMDVRLPTPAKPEDLEAQAKVYATVFSTCARTAGCKAILTWGVNDAHSWIPMAHRGFGAALLYDAQAQPKPARAAVEQALKLLP
jgi:endo-1,4-beta-xylanase